MSNQKPESNSDDISLKDLINKIQNGIRYVKSKWLVIITVSVLCGALGLAYSLYKKPIYTATCTFVLDDGNSKNSLGQYAGLAALAGISTGSGGGGIFQGDNILELYKSRSMIEKTLLTQFTLNGKKQMLIDRYIEFNQLREVWKKKKIPNISFTGNPENFNRSQDSIVTSFVSFFNKQVLNVTKPDKKLGIIQVQVSSTDEIFAKEFANALVDKVNTFYVFTKTKKSLQTVTILQRQADSVRAVLNSSIGGVANAIDATPNANPNMLTLRVPSQKRQIDVQANSAIYGEVVKNLEVSKLSLRQETPLIQVIDNPVYPLDMVRLGKLKAIVIGAFLGAFLTLGFLLSRRFFMMLIK